MVTVRHIRFQFTLSKIMLPSNPLLALLYLYLPCLPSSIPDFSIGFSLAAHRSRQLSFLCLLPSTPRVTCTCDKSVLVNIFHNIYPLIYIAPSVFFHFLRVPVMLWSSACAISLNTFLSNKDNVFTFFFHSVYISNILAKTFCKTKRLTSEKMPWSKFHDRWNSSRAIMYVNSKEDETTHSLPKKWPGVADNIFFALNSGGYFIERAKEDESDRVSTFIKNSTCCE